MAPRSFCCLPLHPVPCFVSSSSCWLAFMLFGAFLLPLRDATWMRRGFQLPRCQLKMENGNLANRPDRRKRGGVEAGGEKKERPSTGVDIVLGHDGTTCFHNKITMQCPLKDPRGPQMSSPLPCR